MIKECISEWTKKFIDICEKRADRELKDEEIFMLIDYAIGFLNPKELEDYAAQGLEWLDIK